MPPSRRRVRVGTAALLVVGTLGCGGDDRTQRWGQVCGEDGPLQLLDGIETRRSPWLAADRIVVGVPAPFPYAGTHGGIGGPSSPPQILSVDPCGADPQPLDAEEAAALLGLPRCGDSVELDGLHAQRTASGVATVVPDGLRWCPDDGSAPIEITAEILRFNVGDDGRRASFATRDDTLLFVDAEHRLTRVELPSATATVLAGGIIAFHVLPTPGRVLVQPYEATDGGGIVETGVHVLATDTGALTQIESGSLLRFDVVWPWGVQTEPSEPSAARIVDLRTNEAHPLPAGIYELRRALPDARALLVRRDESSPLRTHVVWSHDDATVDELVSGAYCSTSRATDTALQIVSRVECGDPHAARFDNGELWEYPFDGAPPRLIADGVGYGWVLTDDRLVWSASGPDGSQYDDLQVRDLSDGTQWQIADNAWMYGDRFDGPRAEAPWAPSDLDGDILYFVDDGDSLSLWRAGIP